MKKQQVYLTGPVLIVIAAVLWALDGILRRSLYTLPPSVVVLNEHIIGTCLLLPFFIKQVKPLTRRELIILALIALLSGLLGTMFFTAALQQVHYISFSVVFLLQKLQPIFAIGSSYVLLREPLKKSYIKWAIIAVVAAYFVTFPTGMVNMNTGTATVIAALYALGAAAFWGSSTSLSKMALAKMPPVVATGWRFIFTIPLALIAVFVLGAQGSLVSTSSMQWFWLLLISLSTGMVGLLIYYKGLSTTRVNISTILELTFPLLAIAIDAVVYKTFLSPVQWIAALVLVFAMYRIAKLNTPHGS